MTHVAWYTARASGFTALLMLTASVAIGLVLGMKLRSPMWPRFLTVDLHRFVTMATLIFIGVHLAALLVDPYMQFSPVELVVPFASGYRAAGMALGITAAYLLLAIWISSQLRGAIGWRWWRRLHYASYALYPAVVGHVLLTGTDAGALWGQAVLFGSLFAVGSLGLARAGALGSAPAAPRASATGDSQDRTGILTVPSER